MFVRCIHRTVHRWVASAPGAGSGLRSSLPDHSRWRYLTTLTWHQHGVYHPPPGTDVLVRTVDGAAVLYVDDEVSFTGHARGRFARPDVPLRFLLHGGHRTVPVWLLPLDDRRSLTKAVRRCDDAPAAAPDDRSEGGRPTRAEPCARQRKTDLASRPLLTAAFGVTNGASGGVSPWSVRTAVATGTRRGLVGARV